MNKLNIFKQVTGFVVSAGAGGVVSNIIKATTPEDIKPLRKGLLVVGGFFLSGMVGDQTAKYAEHQIDEIVEQFNKARDLAKQNRDDIVKGEVINEKNKESK